MFRRAVRAAICGLLAALCAAPAAAALEVAALRERLAAQSRHLGSASGAYVRDLTTGRTLYRRAASVPRSPASNEKLLVTGAALLRYGAGARLQTTLVAERPPADGVLDGDVALVGVGDPYLSRGQLRRLAARVARGGVEVIRGDVLGDGSFFDARRGSYDGGWAYDGDLGGSLGGLVVQRGRGADPALYAAQRLRRALTGAGVTVRGAARAGTLGAEGVAVAAVVSPPLARLIQRINVPSDNFAAEMLLKHLGGAFGAGGTTPAGAAVVRGTLAGQGVDARLYDGSGLSRADQVSPRELVDLLTVLAAEPALRASLPVAGRSGTLADRMRRGAATGRCSAKTGTLRSVSALSGYCDTRSGHLVAFSFVENGMSEYTAKQVEDRMTALIARFSEP